MRRYILIAMLLAVFGAGGAWASSFFGIELATNAITDMDFNMVGTIDSGSIVLASGNSLGIFIGSEMALDFNLKLNFELGFHHGKYLIDQYTLASAPGVNQDVHSGMNYYSYFLLMGVRLKYDLQITDSFSVEPYIMSGLTPIFMYSPSARFETQLRADVEGGRSYTWDQSNIWGLSYYGFGCDIDLTRSEVEHSGSSKYLFGVSVRYFDRNVTASTGTRPASDGHRIWCLTGTVMF